MQMNWIKLIQCSSRLSALKAIIDVIIQFARSCIIIETEHVHA